MIVNKQRENENTNYGKQYRSTNTYPLEPQEFWDQIRLIIREEVTKGHKAQTSFTNIMETPGLTEKPFYKMHEICSLFKVTKPTIG